MKSVKNIILENVTSAFIDGVNSQGGPPIYKLSPAEARKVLEDLQSKQIVTLPVNIEEKTIPVGPMGKISIHIVRPQNVKEKLHPVIYCHGGGWILGSFNTHKRLVSELAIGSHAAIVFVNYTPSPEAKFPIPIEEAFAATKYIADHGKNFDLDTSRMAIAGDSVGGNMAIAVTLLAKERRGPHIEGQLIYYPVTSGSLNTPSYSQFAEGYWLTKPAMEWFFNAYVPNVSDRKHYLISPLNATIDQLTGLPPALIITDENDVLRDEGEEYARRLMQAGVKTCAVRVLGTVHDFAMLNPLANTPATKNAIALGCQFLRQTLKSG